MTVLLYTLGVVVFAVALVVSIGLHEVGHMAFAKKFGGKVTQYFVGFGPTVWSKQVGETEYGLKAIPLGGFVKIVGMLPPGADDSAEPVGVDEHGNPVHRVRKSNTGMFTQLVSDARAAEWETISAEDEPRLFYRMAWWKKVTVMAAGPAVNLLIAFAIFAPLFATYGNMADVRVSPVVADVSACVVPATEDQRVCTDEDPVAPARAAGIEVGDEILSFNGVAASDWDVLQKAIQDNSDGRAEILVRRGDEELTLVTNTTVTARPTGDDDAPLRQVGFLGVTPTAAPQTGGVLYTLDQMGDMTVRTLESLANLPQKVGRGHGDYRGGGA
ncbi:site-2 protease family protein [Nocardioides daphniae]|uniref:site-2 protease family protein n=1 Tax=Nocardioides daphniae TaxID=402297 RepID=UPI001EE8B0E7|nr:site-2 protease family protein [Nocardioides daphniae]